MTASEQLVEYRRQRLMLAGLDPERAKLAAETRDLDVGGYVVDLGEFERLVYLGATPDQAYRVLS